jgi:hypothetical protein
MATCVRLWLHPLLPLMYSLQPFALSERLILCKHITLEITSCFCYGAWNKHRYLQGYSQPNVVLISPDKIFRDKVNVMLGSCLLRIVDVIHPH